MRDPHELLADGLATLELAHHHNPGALIPLLSSGNDSQCASHVASKCESYLHYRTFTVNMIDTGIGAEASRQHARDICERHGWRLKVWRSKECDGYESLIRAKGFPGPGMHKWVFIRLKERALRMMIANRGRVALVSGARIQESERRMGHVDNSGVQLGEWEERKGGSLKQVNLNRVWVSPCHDWSSEEQAAYMDEFDLPRNPVKIALGVSGECFCGAFAKPDELARIRRHCPDVAVEIDRLTGIARECGKHDVWGTRPDKAKGVVVAPTGMMCSGCDTRARAAGLLFAR